MTKMTRIFHIGACVPGDNTSQDRLNQSAHNRIAIIKARFLIDYGSDRQKDEFCEELAVFFSQEQNVLVADDLMHKFEKIVHQILLTGHQPSPAQLTNNRTEFSNLVRTIAYSCLAQFAE